MHVFAFKTYSSLGCGPYVLTHPYIEQLNDVICTDLLLTENQMWFCLLTTQWWLLKHIMKASVCWSLGFQFEPPKFFCPHAQISWWLPLSLEALARLPLSYLHRQNLMCRPLHPNRVVARAIPAVVTRVGAHRAINKQLQYRRCMPRCCNNNSFNNFNSNRWCKVPRWPKCNELRLLPTKLRLQLPSGCHKWVWPKPKRTSCGCSTSRANQRNPCGKSQCLCRNWRDTTQAGPMGGWKCWATKIQGKWSTMANLIGNLKWETPISWVFCWVSNTPMGNWMDDLLEGFETHVLLVNWFAFHLVFFYVFPSFETNTVKNFDSISHAMDVCPIVIDNSTQSWC